MEKKYQSERETAGKMKLRADNCADSKCAETMELFSVSLHIKKHICMSRIGKNTIDLWSLDLLSGIILLNSEV